ncbi:PIG-L deacetylase family protein [Enterococcus sp. LJL51]|uniref:PIG-L deacetylase family protein n=1 Tax=Enterococcus sp. LJL51 TaxID=3416656 RepID=UPI003CF220B9
MKYPEIDDIKSALFIQPHPDDNEIGAGGLIAYLRKKEIPVYSLTVTKGDGGGGDTAPEIISGIRAKEAQEAAKILNQTYLGSLGYSNEQLGTIDEIVQDLVEVIRKYRPDAVFSVDGKLEDEIHPAHLRVGAAVDTAFFRAGQKTYPFGQKKMYDTAFSPRILGKYFTENDNTILDITDYYALKLKAISAHRSQVNEEFLAMLEGYYELLAMETGYEKAERFKLLFKEQTHAFAIPKALKKYLV